MIFPYHYEKYILTYIFVITVPQNILLNICTMLYLIGLPLWLSWERICLQRRSPQFNSWVRKIRWRRDRLPTPVLLDFPSSSAGKESTCSVGDLGSISQLGRYPGEGKGYSLQYSGLENSMERIVHGVSKSWT